MSQLSTILYILIGLLTVDALFEMSFISATVYFLHRRAGGSFEVADNSGFTFPLHGKPLHFLLNQGHTSNGAAGTAIVLVGIGSLLTFPFLHRDAKAGRRSRYATIAHHTWMVVTLLSFLLTFAALIYVMAVTNAHSGQHINLTTASRLNDRPYPNQSPYPLDTWTPENWFAAVLELDLVNSGDRSMIRTKYNVIKGWRWNLIPMFILGLAVLVVGILDAIARRKEMRQSKNNNVNVKEFGYSSEEGAKVESPMLPQEESTGPSPNLPTAVPSHGPAV